MRTWSATELTAELRRDMRAHPSVSPGLGFLRGFHYDPGDTITIAGRTNEGKSFFALSKLAAMAAAGVECAYFSLEDGPRRVGRRVRHQGASASSVLYTFPSPVERDSKTLSEAMRELGFRNGVRAWCIDYIQLVNYGGSVQAWNKPHAVALAVAELQAVARELGGVLILVSQVTRPQPGEGTQLPKLYEMKESAAIENASDFAYIVGSVKGSPTVRVAKVKDAPRGNDYTMVRGAGGVWLEPGGKGDDGEGRRGQQDEATKRTCGDDW